MSKNLLETMYREHHIRGDRYGYLYCHGQRGVYMQEWIGKGKKVLDLGCRDGMLSSFYREGNELIGVDIDQQALLIAEEKLKMQTVWLDLNAEWPFAEDSFDVVVACEILEHIFLLEPILDKILATLKKGGLFIGSVPNAYRMKNRMKFLAGRQYDSDPTHVRQFSFEILHKLLVSRFANIEVVPLQGKILPFWPVSPSAPFALQKLFARDFLWRSEKPNSS